MDIRDNRKETAQIIRIDADGEKAVSYTHLTVGSIAIHPVGG